MDGSDQTVAKALALGAFILGSAVACGGHAPTGEYSTEGTVIVTGHGMPDAEGCGVPQAPGTTSAGYRVSDEGGRIRVTDTNGGCVLDARIEDGVVVADGAACTLGPDAMLRQLGVQSRVYTVFRLDPMQGTVLTRAFTVLNTTTGESRQCFVSERRIVPPP